MWYKFNFAKLTETEIKTLKAKMLQLPPMPMDMFDNIIDNIDEDYPFSLSPKLILALLVTVGICVIALGIILIWYKKKATLSSSTMGNLVKLILHWLVMLHPWTHCCPYYLNLPLLELSNHTYCYFMSECI